MTDRQRRRPAAVVTGEGGELAGRRKLAAALNATSNLPTNIPGIILSWTVNPSVHNWFPSLALKECSLKQRPYDVLYTAS